MLHYSNASSIEKNRRYLVIKGGGGACLVALARRTGRQHRSHTHQRHRWWSRSLTRGKEGEEIVNTKQAMQHNTRHDNTQCRVCSIAVLCDTEEGGTHPRKCSQFRTCARQMIGGQCSKPVGLEASESQGAVQGCLKVCLSHTSYFSMEVGINRQQLCTIHLP